MMNVNANSLSYLSVNSVVFLKTCVIFLDCLYFERGMQRLCVHLHQGVSKSMSRLSQSYWRNTIDSLAGKALLSK